MLFTYASQRLIHGLQHDQFTNKIQLSHSIQWIIDPYRNSLLTNLLHRKASWSTLREKISSSIQQQQDFKFTPIPAERCRVYLTSSVLSKSMLGETGLVIISVKVSRCFVWAVPSSTLFQPWKAFPIHSNHL